MLGTAERSEVLCGPNSGRSMKWLRVKLNVQGANCTVCWPLHSRLLLQGSMMREEAAYGLEGVVLLPEKLGGRPLPLDAGWKAHKF